MVNQVNYQPNHPFNIFGEYRISPALASTLNLNIGRSYTYLSIRLKLLNYVRQNNLTTPDNKILPNTQLTNLFGIQNQVFFRELTCLMIQNHII